jgi:hypothetical protein
MKLSVFLKRRSKLLVADPHYIGSYVFIIINDHSRCEIGLSCSPAPHFKRDENPYADILMIKVMLSRHVKLSFDYLVSLSVFR